jgi:methylase of polypeptide subunit release factors
MKSQIISKPKPKKIDKNIDNSKLLMNLEHIKENSITENLIKNFFELLSKNYLNKKVESIYSNWVSLFNLSNPSDREYTAKRRQSLERIFNTEINRENEQKAVFAIHTTISIITKLLTYNFLSNLTKQSEKPTPDKISLKKFFENIESGNAYKKFGIINMCEYDFFSWYLYAEFNDELYTLLSTLKDKISKHKFIENNTSEISDPMKSIYESLVPKEVRHSFGETYTPQKYADIILNESKKFLKDKISYKAIDPTCGSGAFLLSAIKDKINSNRIEQVFDEVVGMDLNPVAVIMAKFNYIRATYPTLIKTNKIPLNLEIPVYLGDSLNIPDIPKIKNFDLIIGNPPWIRWSILPKEYRESVKKSLRKENMFSTDTNYGGIDLNLSAIIAHNVIKNLLNKEGVFSFIFPYGVLNNQSYQGFRNFKFGNKKMKIKTILKFTKPIFKEEESIVLILQNSEIIEEKQKQLNLL